MTQKLSAARGVDMRIVYYFPQGSDLTGCTGRFIVYDALGGHALLSVDAFPNGRGSQVRVDATTVTLDVRQGDIESLPPNADPASPNVLYFDLRLTTPSGLVTKMHGGGFVVLPLGARTYLNNGAVNAAIGGDPVFVQFASVASFGGGNGGGGGGYDPYAVSNLDVLGGTEAAFDTAVANARSLGFPLTGNAGTVTITGPKSLTDCAVNLPYKVIRFGVNMAASLAKIRYIANDVGVPWSYAVTGPAIEMGGSPAGNVTYAKTIRVVGNYTGNGANQSLPFTAVRILNDQAARSSLYDIGLQNHRGDGLEINSDTEKKNINVLFDHIYQGYALTFRANGGASPDEVAVRLTGTFCTGLVHAQDQGQFSYRVDFLVESLKPWWGTFAIDDASRKGVCYAGEIRGCDGDLIKVETRYDGSSSAGPTLVFDSLRIIQHYCGRIILINPKSVGGTIYHDQVDTGRYQGSNYVTTAYRNWMTGSLPITLSDEAGFQIGEVLENCTLTYVTRRNVCPYGARIGISDWVKPYTIDDETHLPQGTGIGSAFDGKTIRLEVEMGDRNIAGRTVTGSVATTYATGSFAPLTVTGSVIVTSVTGSVSGATLTVTSGGPLVVGQLLYRTGLPDGTRVIAIGTGGQYTLSETLATPLLSGVIIVDAVLTVTSGEALNTGQLLEAEGLKVGTRVMEVLGANQYRINQPVDLGAGPIAIGTRVTITSAHTLMLGQWLQGPGIPKDTRVTAVLGSGQYAVMPGSGGPSFTLPSMAIGIEARLTVTAGGAPALGAFLKGEGLPPGLRIMSISGSIYRLNMVANAASMAIATGATSDMFYAIWADYGTGSTIWATGNLAGNIRITQGWQRGTVHVSAAWVRKGFTVDRHTRSTTEFIIHGPISFAELTAIPWRFEGVQALNVTDYDGLSMRFDGAKWVFSRLIDVPAVTTEALGSPLNAGNVKRRGVSVIDQATGTILVAQGAGPADAWLSTAGGTVSPHYLSQTTDFDSRQQAVSGVWLGEGAKLVYDRLFHDLIYAGVYDPGDSAASLLKGLYLFNGPSDGAARTNLLFPFWKLKNGGAGPSHTPKVGYVNSADGNCLELENYAADTHGITGHSIAIGACAETLYTSDEQKANLLPYTIGSNTNQVRGIFHRSDGGNSVTLNATDAVSAATFQAGSYRLGMGFTDGSGQQNIMLYGGTLVTGDKTPGTAGVDNLYVFRAEGRYLKRTLSMALVGKGVGWTPKKVEAALAALNLARTGLRGL